MRDKSESKKEFATFIIDTFDNKKAKLFFENQ